MKNRMFIASVLAAATVAVAQADHTNYEFTYWGTPGTSILATGSVVVSGTAVLSGSVTLSGTSMDGTYTFMPSTGIANSWLASPLGSFNTDGWMDCDSDPALTVYGLLFVDGSGNEVNIWGNGPGNYSLYGSTAYGVYPVANDGGTFECHKVPAPGALALLGCAGLIGSRRRRS